MKILINTPPLNSPAGVSSHYLGLRPYFSRKVVYNKFFTTNYLRKRVKYKFLHRPLRLTMMGFDVVKFVILLFLYQRPKVLLNPSFNETAIKRDVLFLSIAKFFGCKVAVFIHGWDKEYLDRIFNGKIRFHFAWRKADTFFVLAKEFKGYLERLGIKAPVHLTTTKVNDRLLEGINGNTKSKEIQTILFLARVEKTKGIFTTIDTFKILKKKWPDLKLRVVGPGKMLAQAKAYAVATGINNIIFTGPLYGEDLKNEFIRADLYILPTHSEGMPTSVLEAMAFGLPVITRPVGGLIDFFEDGKMGYMIDSFDPVDYAAKIEELIKNSKKYSEICENNMRYAKEHFMASNIALNLERILSGL